MINIKQLKLNVIENNIDNLYKLIEKKWYRGENPRYHFFSMGAAAAADPFLAFCEASC